MEGQHALRGRGGKVGDAWVVPRAETRQLLREEGARPLGGGQAQHGRLLLDLAAPAVDRQAGMALQAVQLVLHLPDHLGMEDGIRKGIIHVGEHEVLPHQDPQLVAQVVEGVRLVDHGAAHPQQVEAGLPGEDERTAEGPGIASEAADVLRSPAGPAGEHWAAIHHQLNGTPAAVHGHGLEPGGTEVHGDRTSLRLQAQGGLDPGRRPVGVGPPEGRVGKLGLALDAGGIRARVQGQRELTATEIQAGAGDPVSVQDPHLGVQRSVAFGPDGPGPEVGAEEIRPSDPLQADLPPGTHGGQERGPAGDAPQKGSADPAEALLGHQGRLPAGAGAADGQFGAQRPEADPQLVGGAEAVRDRAGQGREHGAGLGQADAVQPDLGEGGQALESEADLLAGARRGGGEGAAVPPVQAVEIGSPVQGQEQALGHSAGDGGRLPGEARRLATGGIRAGAGRAGRQLPPITKGLDAVGRHPRPRMGLRHRALPKRRTRPSMAPSQVAAMASRGDRSMSFFRAMALASWNWKALVDWEISSKAACVPATPSTPRVPSQPR